MNIASLIDHTVLKPEATLKDIEQLCTEARQHHFFSVCINPYWITSAKPLLTDTKVKICTVVGFPLGATLPQAKAHETIAAIAAGADEIDMVINIGAALEGHWHFIEHEVHDVVSQAQGHIVKVILETCLLSPEQITSACQACVRGGASFVKTSTGFNSSGATIDAVKIMRATVGEKIGVKASGGIRNIADAQAMIAAGASRLGTSAGVAIVTGTNGSASY